MSQQGSSGCLKFFLIGCGVCILLAVGLVVGGYYLVKTKGPELAAYAVMRATDGMLAGSGLSEEEKAGVREQVERVAEKIRAGEIGASDFERLEETLDEMPFVGLVLLAGFNHGAIQTSGLSDEEKEKASTTIRQFQRGLVEDKLSVQELRTMFEEVSKSRDEETKSGQDLTDEDIRSLLTEMDQRVNAAEIPDTTYSVDFVAETRDAVDVFLGEEVADNVETATP